MRKHSHPFDALQSLVLGRQQILLLTGRLIASKHLKEI